MAEKKHANEVTLEAKYILAAYDVPKSSKKELAGRRMLQGVHVRFDREGLWRIDATDSFKLARIERKGFAADGATGFTLPPETIAEFKQGDLLTFKPSEDGLRCHVVKVAKGNLTEWDFNLIEGKYPNVDQLIPEPQPLACRRYATKLNADYMACLMGVARKCFGKGSEVVFATHEDEPNRPVMGYAYDRDIELTLLMMPVKLDEHPKLEDERPKHNLDERNRELREQLKAAEANADMWKEKALQQEQELKGGADKRIAELEGELVKAKAERDEFAKKFREEKAKRIADKAKEETGAEVEVKVTEGDVTAVEIAPKKEELVKKPTKKSAPKAPKAPKADMSELVIETALTVSEMQEKLVKFAEGKDGLRVEWANENSPVWLCGNSRPWKGEIEGKGLRFGSSKKYGKGWYYGERERAALKEKLSA